MRHILSCCPTALNQGRYTCRHDSILAHLTQLLKLHLPYGSTLYADLLGLRASENPAATIPTSVATTTARPDVVIIQNNRITLLELTVPTNTPEGLQEARRWKQLKPNYLALLNDLKTLGFQSALETIEVGTLGHFNNQTIASLHTLFPNLRKNSVRRLLLGLSKTSVSCSAHIFITRLSTTRSHPHSLALFPPLADHPQAPIAIPPLNPIFFSFFKPMYKCMYAYYCIVPPHPLPLPCKLPPSPFPQNTSHACQ